jgi:cytochrome c-type biogenesis protein CcmH/NrfG
VTAQHHGPKSPRSMVVLATIGIVGLCVVLAMYWLNRPIADEPVQQPNHNASSVEEQMRQSLERPAIIARLKAKLDKQPEDAQGWMLLARSQAQIGQYAESVEAYRRALQLQPNEASVLAEFADVLANRNGAKFDGEPNTLLMRALSLDPNNPPALFLSGLAAFDRGDWASAVSHWEHVLRVVEPANLFAQHAQQGIASVRARQNQRQAESPGSLK